MSRDVLPRSLISRIHLSYERHALTGGSWDIPNMNFEPGKSKWVAKGNLEEMPHISYLNFHEGTIFLSLRLVPGSIYTYCSLSPPNKHFTCFLTFCLCGNFFLQSQRARALSLTTYPVARIWCSHHCTWPQFLARNQSPASSHCRLKLPEIISGYILLFS